MTAKEKAQEWLSESYDLETQQEVTKLLQNPAALEDAFYTNLAFGTGGMRGIMGVGTNRINKYTLGAVTQGLSNYINQQFPKQNNAVAIAYDVRNNSNTFAKTVANILTANNIKVYLFESFRPTPELSFAVRYLKCTAGIVLTASHNPPEYNGYKVYWNDGGQIVPPHDKAIINEVNKVTVNQIQFNGKEENLTIIGSDIDEVFIDACVENGSFTQEGKKDLKIVFTSIHGTSIAAIPTALEKAGFTQVTVVKEQAEPNGNFPTVKSPNPEEPEALKMALELAEQINADIVIGTDPDADRLGIAVRNNNGEMILLNGNQTNTVLINYLLNHAKNNNQLTGKEFIGSTIVTSDIFFDLAKIYQVECKVGLTGFKWIADMIRKSESKQRFIGGGEESFGFMVGDFLRDKDSVTSTLLACEITALAKASGGSFYQELLKIYTQTGAYQEDLISIVKTGKEGAQQIKQMMINLRDNPPKKINNSTIIQINDYQTSIAKNLVTGQEKKLDIPSSNVLIFYTEDGSKIAVRPSGTEPKIKFYFSVKSDLKSIDDYDAVKQNLTHKIESLKKAMNP